MTWNITKLKSHAFLLANSRRIKTNKKRTKLNYYIIDADCNWDGSVVAVALESLHDPSNCEKIHILDDSLRKKKAIRVGRRIYFIVLDKEGKRVYVSLKGSTIRAYSTDTGKCKLVLKKDEVFSPFRIAINSPYNNLLFAASANGILKVWNIENNKEIFSKRYSNRNWSAISFDSEGQGVYIGSTAGSVFRMDLSKNTVSPTDMRVKGKVKCISQMKHSKKICVISSNNLKMFQKGEALLEMTPPKNKNNKEFGSIVAREDAFCLLDTKGKIVNV